MGSVRPWHWSVFGFVGLVAACSKGGGGTTTTGSGGTTTTSSVSHGGSAATSSTAAGGDGDGGGAPSCWVPDVSSSATQISVQPAPLDASDAPVISVTDTTTGHTNVALTLCTPGGLVTPTFGGVDSSLPPFAWHWVAAPLSPGATQAVFRADPAGTVYATAELDVAPAPLDAGADASVAPGLCDDPPGNLLAHGTFEEGFDQLAPHGWQVRDPALPGGPCLQSGTPGEHVFLGPGAPSCGGNAVTIDARGQWDCYAIQRFSDDDTIEGGFTYRISVTARSQGNAVNPAAWFIFGAQWLDAGDVVFGDVKNPKPALASMNDFDWQVVSFDVLAPPEARRIVVWLSGHYPGRVDYDNVAVVKVGGP